MRNVGYRASGDGGTAMDGGMSVVLWVIRSVSV
jgi:hypothetical protein